MDFEHDFAGLERGGEGVEEEIGGGHGAVGVGRHQADVGIEREQRGGIIGGRIGVGDAAADGAHVAHLHIADAAGGFGQQRGNGRG